MDFNNLGFLTKLGGIVQLLAIVLIFIGGGMQFSKFLIDKKVNKLKETISSTEKEKAEKIISELKLTINQQVSKVEEHAKVVAEQMQIINKQSEEVKFQQQRIRKTASQYLPRIISPENVSVFVGELSKSKGESINITCLMGDQEGFSFASQLKEIFEKAGWTVNGINQAMYTKPILGLILILKNESIKDKAEKIFRLLLAAGYHSEGEINPQIGTDLGIIVGARK